jgi:hypothetical protein
MRVARLDARTHATSIYVMAIMESHLRVFDEYLISCTIFFCYPKNIEIACVTIVGK